MIQFNLLPDVKLAYVKAQRTKRLVIGSALIATAASFAIFLLLFIGVHIVQKVRISQLSGDIKSKTATLKENDDLDKVLTIQNQLNSLTGLHEEKVASSRTLAFIQQVTPSEVTINNLSVDFTTNIITISGLSPSLDRVNTFIDTLKFSKFNKVDDADGQKAFTDVVLAQFGRSETATSYNITLSYDPALFGPDVNSLLIVPKGVTTSSVTDQPGALFKKAEQDQTGQSGQGN